MTILSIFLLKKNQLPKLVEKSILEDMTRVFSYRSVYSMHVPSISLYGILEGPDALEVDTYDTRCNCGNMIKRSYKPQPGVMELRRNVLWNRPIVSISIPTSGEVSLCILFTVGHCQHSRFKLTAERLRDRLR